MKDSFQNKNLKEKYDEKSDELRKRLKNVQTLEEALAITNEIKELDKIKKEFINSLNFNETNLNLNSKEIKIEYNLIGSIDYFQKSYFRLLQMNAFTKTKIKVYIPNNNNIWKKIYESDEQYRVNFFINKTDLELWDGKIPLKIVVLNVNDFNSKDTIYFKEENFVNTINNDLSVIESIDYRVHEQFKMKVFEIEFKNINEKELKVFDKNNTSIYSSRPNKMSLTIFTQFLSGWDKDSKLKFQIKDTVTGITDNIFYTSELLFYKEDDEEKINQKKEEERLEKERLDQEKKAKEEEEARIRAEANKKAREDERIRKDKEEKERLDNLEKERIRAEKEAEEAAKRKAKEDAENLEKALSKIKQLESEIEILKAENNKKPEQSNIEISGNSIVNIEESNVTFTEENDVTIANQMIEDSKVKINELIEKIKNLESNL